MIPSLYLEQCLTTVGTQCVFVEWMNEHTEKYGLWIQCCSPVEFSQICASWCPSTPQCKCTNSWSPADMHTESNSAIINIILTVINLLKLLSPNQFYFKNLLTINVWHKNNSDLFSHTRLC